MKNSIVADGEARLRKCGDFHDRLRELHTAICARYAEELEQAGFFRRFLIHRRIEAEFRKERRKQQQEIEPSKYSLYGNRIVQ